MPDVRNSSERRRDRPCRGNDCLRVRHVDRPPSHQRRHASRRSERFRVRISACMPIGTDPPSVWDDRRLDAALRHCVVQSPAAWQNRKQRRTVALQIVDLVEHEQPGTFLRRLMGNEAKAH